MPNSQPIWDIFFTLFTILQFYLYSFFKRCSTDLIFLIFSLRLLCGLRTLVLTYFSKCKGSKTFCFYSKNTTSAKTFISETLVIYRSQTVYELPHTQKARLRKIRFKSKKNLALFSAELNNDTNCLKQIVI